MSVEAERQFVDTNILVYAHDAAAGEKHHKARQLLVDLWQSRRGCLSVQVLQEFYVTVTHKVAVPLSAEAAAAIIRDLSTWRVHTPAAEDVLAAIALQSRMQLSFWDAMILHSANTMRCAVIWTDDLSDGQCVDITMIRNPFQNTPE
ncbi:MAG: PIN domain-containing protein [Anaerolineae bacterium]|nr:PIN domain-containing protein [Anaerolineae bacterium]MCO5206182.1 PIN domain-containing protein [Anaerolineae bacterium]